MKAGETTRRWTPEEDAELQALAEETYNTGLKRWRGRQDYGRLGDFARKHGRTVQATFKRAQRIAARSYARVV